MGALSRRLGAAALLLLALPLWADIITVESEIRIGREAAGEVERQLPISRDPVLRSRVERIGRRLALVSGRPELPFEFQVVDAREVNAFALPGGFVYVYRGLLQSVPNDDAVAFILGHEIVHATRRHAVKQLRKNTILEIVSLPLRRWIGGTGRDWLRLIMQQMYSRDDESEADRMGLELSTRAGFSPDGGPQAMETLLKMYGAGGPRILVLLQDHPATDARVKKLKAQATSLKSARATPPAPGEVAQGATESEAVSPPPAPLPALSPLIPRLPEPGADHPLYPLAAGSRWSYRVTDASGTRGLLVVRAIERVPGDEAVYRLEWRFNGVAVANARMTASAQGVWRLRAQRWQPDWRFVSDEQFRIREESITVPHGIYNAVRVEQWAGDQCVQVAWFVRGLGLVQREARRAGLRESLQEYEAGR